MDIVAALDQVRAHLDQAETSGERARLVAVAWDLTARIEDLAASDERIADTVEHAVARFAGAVELIRRRLPDE
jgi:hypothetical protein